MGLISSLFGSYSQKELKRIEPIKQKTLDLAEKYEKLDDKTLANQTDVLKSRLTSGETLDDILPDAFAVCREAMNRIIHIKPYPVQIVGGIVLHQGRIAEMKTGEGKTFVAALPAYLNALSGKGVLVVTVNDYLAKYGSEQIGRVLRFLGMKVGLISHEMRDKQRKEAYAADVTYGTNSEFGFDYLRDNMKTTLEGKNQRPFNFAIVDEVDSILIDEARTPLIISGQGEKSSDLYQKADAFAKSLKGTKVKELDNKQDEDDKFEGFDYIVDEKAKTCTILPLGVKKAEEYFKIDNLMDEDNIKLYHHVNQAIRAYGIMKNEVDYVVKDDEILIVDEFTGRLMEGRRYNEGLHQAIEAKEGIKIKNESKTFATITYQNFFRLFPKLSGMTGTAMTEDAEFKSIYSLDVVEIPTNKDISRIDNHDQVYKTEQGKFNAIIEQVIECHKKHQPVLIGTVSIAKSEYISDLLKKKKIPHKVLNAKYHEKEAEIVAQAGKKDAVTVATNMAGRGTDIMLGGNAEFLARQEMRRLKIGELVDFKEVRPDLIEVVKNLARQNLTDEMIFEAMGFAETENPIILAARDEYKNLYDEHKKKIAPEAEEVRKAGGLFVIGSERHESRRIDNQLRGRSGRQGDPGESRFYISLEDELMRLFGGERLQKMMNIIGLPEDTPIEANMLSKSIESAQKKVEGRNFATRKHVLDFDDVMNQQRKTVYSQRDKVLEGGDVSENIKQMIIDSMQRTIELYCPSDIPDDWNLTGLRASWLGVITSEDDFHYSDDEINDISRKSIEKELIEKAFNVYNVKENAVGEEAMRSIERSILLKNVDEKWMDHIDMIDALKDGVYARSIGAQGDPVAQYRIDAFNMYDEMIETVREDTVRMLLSVNVRSADEPPAPSGITFRVAPKDVTDLPQKPKKPDGEITDGKDGIHFMK